MGKETKHLECKKGKKYIPLTRDALKNDDIKYASWLVTLGDWDIF